jgi:hypothetical protein
MPILDVKAAAPKTVGDLVRGSLRLIGAIATGGRLSGTEMQDAIAAFNGMLESWNLEHLVASTLVKNSFTLVPGQQDYAMGPGGDFDCVRPISIDAVYLQIGDAEYPVDVVGDAEFNAIVQKSFSGQYPCVLHNHGDFPLTSVSVWPVPQAGYPLNIYTWSQLTSVRAASDVMVLPPGYERALRYGLAIELAPEYGKSITPEIAETYNNAKSAVKRINSQPDLLRCDDALVSDRARYSILSNSIIR